MARDIFRQRWFPPAKKRFNPPPPTTTNVLVGQSVTASVGSFIERVDENFNLTGQAVTASAGSLTALDTKNINLVGLQVNAQAGSLADQASSNVTLVGEQVNTASTDVVAENVISGSGHVTAQSGTFNLTYSNLFGISGQQANALAGAPQTEKFVNLVGVQAQTNAGVFNLGGTPGPRTFFIAGVKQAPIAPGIVMYPTSDSVTVQTANGNHYAVGSSQFYTIGQVYWNSTLRVLNTDYEMVEPFGHIIKILVNPSSISGNITLVYYKWNIGVRAGFQVNSYPVPFAFTGTTISAEEPPATGQFFTVQFTSTRPGTNPQSLFTLYPLMVDDMLADHTTYDPTKGFQTFRPTCYQVLDTTLMEIFEWEGSFWAVVDDVPDGTQFYVKSLRAIYENQGGVATLKYTAGDGLNGDYPQVIPYPPYGESIGKNFLADAFSAEAATNYPSAYAVAQTPGVYDSICQAEGVGFDDDFDFLFDEA